MFNVYIKIWDRDEIVMETLIHKHKPGYSFLELLEIVILFGQNNQKLTEMVLILIET